jgi:hypothetical protein
MCEVLVQMLTCIDKSKNRDRRKTVQVLVDGLCGFGDSFNNGPGIIINWHCRCLEAPWFTPLPNVKPDATSLHPQEMTSCFILPRKPRDAFEGLSLSSDCMPPTLGKVQNLNPNGFEYGCNGQGSLLYQVGCSRMSNILDCSELAPTPHSYHGNQSHKNMLPRASKVSVDESRHLVKGEHGAN